MSASTKRLADTTYPLITAAVANGRPVRRQQVIATNAIWTQMRLQNMTAPAGCGATFVSTTITIPRRAP